MTHLELRNKFFKFWESKNHVVIPSSSLVPENDPTTLFTGSGMQPMMPYLLGAPHPLGTRLVDIQKCFRGQDIEEVGDNRHDSFFEMMGNWSLGDFFKEKQIPWYWEFLTKELNLPAEKLYVSVFGGDEGFEEDSEAIEIWKSIGVPDDHIFKYGAKKNWWSRAGAPSEMPVGEPGGPSSEVFFEFTQVSHDKKFGETCHPNCDCGRFIEIGNNVFMTYLKKSQEEIPAKGFQPLARKNIDFGGGLERTLAAVNNDLDIFKTDLYSLEIEQLEKLAQKKFGGDETGTMVFRVIADHLKAAVFLINDGVLPSNKDRGYVLRRLIRRSVRFAKTIGIEESFVQKVVDAVLKIYKKVYPELDEKKISEILIEEENKFRRTLDNGLKELEKILIVNTGWILNPESAAEKAFNLYQTYGFPEDIFLDRIKELESPELKISVLGWEGEEVFREKFNKLKSRHQDLSRTAGKGMFKGGLADHSEQVTKYHTATHLLQAALRKVLGEHVHQEGSNLTAERLRFDFSHNAKLTPEELKRVEEVVSSQIEKGLERKVETMSYDEAIKSGAMAFFKERYPEKVTVYSFGDFSKEICGGPHVENTKVLGKFKILKEEAVSSGVRRIYAVLE